MGLFLSIASEILAYRDEVRHSSYSIYSIDNLSQKGKAIPYCNMNPTVYLTIGEEGGTELGTIAIKLSK